MFITLIPYVIKFASIILSYFSTYYFISDGFIVISHGVFFIKSIKLDLKDKKKIKN